MNTLRITFLVNGEKLIGDLYIPDNKDGKLPGVVIYHGSGSSKKRHEDRAVALAEAGFITFNFDFRGCGESDGDFADQTISKSYQDALGGYDVLISSPLLDRSRVGIWGGSYGGYLATLVTKSRPVKSLLLAAPAIFSDDWREVPVTKIEEEEKEMFRREAELNKKNTEALKLISDFKGSLLIEEHEKDEIIPHRIVKAYYDAAVNASPKSHVVIKNSPHALHDEKFRKESSKIAVGWFKKTL